jgi:hypothetical protein
VASLVSIHSAVLTKPARRLGSCNDLIPERLVEGVGIGSLVRLSVAIVAGGESIGIRRQITKRRAGSTTEWLADKVCPVRVALP